jgi:hypothetical protein
MSDSSPVSPTDFVPPPSYQISQKESNPKTSPAIQPPSSTISLAIDEDGWPIYNAEAFEAVAESYEHEHEHEHSVIASSSAGILGLGADSSRQVRRGRPSYLKLSTITPMKV